MIDDPYYSDDRVTVHAGDSLQLLRSDLLGYDHTLGYHQPLIPDASIDSVVTDPPYGLDFMGKEWDSPGRMTGQLAVGDEIRGAFAYGGTHDRGHAAHDPVRFGAWCQLWTAECLRVLKPGGHMLAFGGSRTWHRLAAAAEDAGFEIRDSIAWLYGSGFPKSLDVSKAIDKAAGAEREVVGQGATFGKGSLRNASRVEQGYRPTELNPEGGASSISSPATPAAEHWQGWGTALKPAFEPIVVARKPLTGTVAANVLAHGTGAINVAGCRIPHSGKADLAQSMSKNRHADFGSGPRSNEVYNADHRARSDGGNYDGAAGRWPANVVLDEHQAAELDQRSGIQHDGVAVNRNRGVERPMEVAGAPRRVLPIDQGYGGVGGASRFFYVAKAGADERVRLDGVAHPTVKPLSLMRWLVRLVTQPGGLVLEPFAGSGTTVEACLLEGFRCIAMERESDYLPLIRQRLHRRVDPVSAVKAAGGDAGLFDLLGEVDG